MCIAPNVYLSWRFVDNCLKDLQSIYADRGLPQAAAGTSLERLNRRACKTNVQYAARILAFDSLMRDNLKSALSSCNSISHTRGAAAFVWGDGTEITAVGVDIEPKNRRLAAKYEKFFLNRSDVTIDLDRLSVWCLKEAAFKCLDRFEGRAGLLDVEMCPDSLQPRWRCRLADKTCYVVSVDAVAGYRVAVAWSSM
jgi:phosphopantetheinyl transferase (holo-ACP synthase)